ncbi:MAG: hypothetical protein FK730_02810 [Asgard group archaeon]|nr:hypothetical protein [Asgard group archaeon]
MSEVEKLFSSFEVACEEGNFESAEEMILELEKLSKKQKGVNEFYTLAVAKALEKFKGRFSSTKVKKMIASIEELIEKNPKDEKLTNNYAKILRSSLIAMSFKGQPNAMQEIITYLETLAETYPDNIVIHEELSLASHEISYYWKNRGDFKALRERTQKFRKLAEKFPDNEKIKLNLTKSLVLEIDSSRKSDIAKIDTILSEIQDLSESMPTNVGLQLEWVHAYRTAMDRSHEKPEDAKRWLGSMKKIASNKKEDAFKLELAKGYLNAISILGEQNKEELSKHLDELEMLADTTKDNLELQTIYAQSLITSLKVLGIGDLKETQEILDELKELVDNYPTNNVIIEIYVQSLIGIIGLLVQGQKAEDISQFLKQFEDLEKKFEGNEFIEKTYDELIEQLKFLGFKKEKKKKKRDIGFM